MFSVGAMLSKATEVSGIKIIDKRNIQITLSSAVWSMMQRFALPPGFIIAKEGVTQTGQSKKDLIAWRGFPNASGVMVDDFNVATNIGANEGDIRPTPTLLPVPYSTRSRARSIWIDTGASARRPLTSPDGNPRGIVYVDRPGGKIGDGKGKFQWQGGFNGDGFLYVNGDLDIKGDFTFRGLIYTEGELKVHGEITKRP